MERHLVRALMERAIEVAKKSKSEDDRHHPFVGAVLADDEGREILSRCRGQNGGGAHAEYAIIAAAEEQHIDLRGKSLFVTLEPCSRRSPSKTPCAVRVARSGIKSVYIGTLDPNPQIIGRGANFLIAEGIAVEHFPADLRQQLIDLNAAFQGTHAYLVDPIIPDPGDAVAARQRSGILSTTLDLIATAKDEVRIFTGDTSWLRDLFVGLLESSLNGCSIKMIAQKKLPDEATKTASAIGITLSRTDTDSGMRATIVMSGGAPKSMVVMESSPARHAQIFSSPHDNAVLQTFSNVFDQAWDERGAIIGSKAHLQPIAPGSVIKALKKHVDAYSNADIELVDVEISQLLYLTNDVEILKLRRVASTNRILSSRSLQAPAQIVGTPWGFFPPIVELNDRGKRVVIDGIHRVYGAKLDGHLSIKAFVVAKAAGPMPAQPLSSWNPTIIARKQPREARYSQYDPNGFRPIRTALENGDWIQS